MPKKTRLSGADLRSTRPSKRLHGALFSVSILPLSGRRAATVVVSKAVASKAVDRNLLKRRAREALRSLMVRVPAGMGLVVTAKKGAAGASLAEIKRDLSALIEQL